MVSKWLEAEVLLLQTRNREDYEASCIWFQLPSLQIQSTWWCFTVTKGFIHGQPMETMTLGGRWQILFYWKKKRKKVHTRNVTIEFGAPWGCDQWTNKWNHTPLWSLYDACIRNVFFLFFLNDYNILATCTKHLKHWISVFFMLSARKRCFP